MEDPLRCPRCGIGIDDDGDGNCAFCAGKNDTEVAFMKQMRQLNPLRDQFAMAALTGIIAHGVKDKFNDTDIAATAYHIADAMLEARKR